MSTKPLSDSIKRWREANPDKLQAIQARNRFKLRIEALESYGWNCACCGESRYEFLSIDHIKGGGTQHRIELGKGARIGSRAFYLWLKRNSYPEGFRVLCNNCNMSIGAYGYCPHEKEHTCQSRL